MSDLFKRTEVNFGGAMASEYGLLVPNRRPDRRADAELAAQYART
jgi:hypothetical protein